VSGLKQQLGKDILIFGSGELVNTLMQHDLINEYRLMVFPIVVGSGKRLFEGKINTTILELVDLKSFGTSVVVLTYQTAGRQDASRGLEVDWPKEHGNTFDCGGWEHRSRV